MNTSTARILALSLLMIASGCARALLVSSQSGTKPYVPLIVPIEASRDSTRAAVEKVLLAAGRTAGTNNGDQIEVLQYSAADERDRISVRFLPANQIAVTFMTELQGADGAWLSTDSVCPTYSYTREREIAGAVAAAALDRYASEP